MSRTARRRWLDLAAILAALAIAGMLSWLAIAMQLNQERIDALSLALADEQSAAEARGEEPVAPEPGDLIDDPQDYTGPQGPAGPPPSEEAVAAAVADYFAAHPVEDGETPSPAAVAAAVANYLAEHPPERGEPGPPPSAEQVADAVAAYLTANPPPPGPPGADGEDGRTPTAEELAGQIAAAVEDYLTEHPLPPRCPEGYEFTAATLLTLGGPPLESVVCAAAGG